MQNRLSTRSAAWAAALVAASLCLPAFAARKPIELRQATQVGQAVFPPGDSVKGGQGQPVDGIEALGHEELAAHYHAHLAIFYRGRQLAVPYGIGVVKPFHLDRGFVDGGQAFYWLHTHDATGIIHVESPDHRTYTLGEFFDVWGEPLSPEAVGGLKGKVRAYVDGKPFEGDPRSIPLTEHGQVTLVVGEPAVKPPVYAFPKGL